MQNLAQRLQGHLNRSRIVLYGLSLPLMAFALADLGSSALRIIYVVLGFSLIIFLHELGHFVVARSCSVKCLAFSLGIGPRAFGWRKGAGLTFGADRWDPDYKNKKKAGKTEQAEAATTHSDLPTSADEPPHSAQIGNCDYRLSWLPLGGYVRMLGQDDMDPTKVSKDPFAFNMRPIWQRMCIVSAGVIMNLIFALVAFSIIFRVGVKFPIADIGFVAYNSPADKAGLKMGDRIVAIDGEKPRSGGFVEFTDVVIASALASGDRDIVFDYQRPGVKEIQQARVRPIQPPEGGFLAIGVEGMPSLNLVSSKEVLDDAIKFHKKPVSEGGYGDPDGAKQMEQLHKYIPGGRITAVDSQPIEDYLDLYNKVQALGDKPVALTIHDPQGKETDTTITIKPHLELQRGVEDYPLVFGLGPRIEALKVMPGSAAEKAGVKDGDEIASVGDRRWPTLKQLIDLVSKNAGKELDLTVIRDGKPLNLKVTPAKQSGVGRIGIETVDARDDLAVVPREGGSGPAADVLGPDDQFKIAAVDGTTVHNWDDVFALLKAKKAGDQVTMQFEPIAAATTESSTQPAARSSTFTMEEPFVHALARETHYMLNVPVDILQKTQQADNFTDASLMGLEHTQKFVLQVYMTLAGLVRGTISPTNLHGIVGITKVGYDIQERGMAWFWYLMGIVSINLAVVNFLPLPIVDGGLFLLLILEKIRGKPLSLKVQSAIQIVGIVILAGMFIFVTFNDIKLFGK